MVLIDLASLPSSCRLASNWISSKEADLTCLGTSRLDCDFISAPVGVRDLLKVERSLCILAWQAAIC